MNKLYHVLVTYATRRLHMFILFVIMVVGVFMIYVAGSGDRGSDSSDIRPILPPPLLFPVVMLNLSLGAFLGAFLKQQMATYRAALVPGYRTPHLIAAAVVVLFPLAVFTVTAAVGSLPLPGIIALLSFAAMTGLYGGNGSQPAFLPTFAFLMATFFVPHLRAAVFEMLNGQQPGMAWSLISTALAGTALLFHRLATLTEDDPDFGKVMPMDPWDLRASAVRTQTRAVMQRSSGINLLMTAPVSRRLDRITNQPATTSWQRVTLLRLSDDAPVNVWGLTGVLTTFGIASLVPAAVLVDRQVALKSVFMLITIANIVQINLTFRRWSRLGYESLRPQTRQQWVIENALAIICNCIVLQAAMLTLNGILISIFLQGAISTPLIVNTLLLFVSIQMLIFGLCSWLASFGSLILTILATGVLVAFTIPSSITLTNQQLDWHGIPVTLALAGITSIIGIAFCWMAYRRWCRIDLA